MRKCTLVILIVAFISLLSLPAFAGRGCNAMAKKGGCTAAERAACAAKGKSDATAGKSGCSHGKSTAGVQTLPNGHPAISIAEARKCGEATTAFLAISKMTGGGCVSQVTKALGGIDGVCAVDVDLKGASATVVFHENKVKLEKLIAAVTQTGYPVSLMEMGRVDNAQLKELCRQRCGDKCDGKCLARCVNSRPSEENVEASDI